MREKEINIELLRLTIITILIASMFGILQYFPEDKVFDKVGIGVILKVAASTMLYSTFPIFAIYLMFLGLNSRYERKKYPRKVQAFLYDLGLFFTSWIIIFTLLFTLLVWILVKFPTFPMPLIVSLIWIFILFSAIIIFIYLQKLFRNKKQIH